MRQRGSRGLDTRLSLGGSLTLGLRENLWDQVNHNAKVGRGNYTAHFVTAGLCYEF